MSYTDLKIEEVLIDIIIVKDSFLNTVSYLYS